MANDWKEYQEEAATFFRSLGLSADTDVRLTGVRTSHDVDVVVRSRHVGFEILWLVECKFWKTPVTKLHVLGLREIVQDLGADRGIALSESGFQSGANEAANLTNIQLTSLASLRETTKHDISSMRLRELFDRVEICNDQYWSISKTHRIKTGLRGDSMQMGFSGDIMIGYFRDILTQAMRGRYPFRLEHNFASAMETFTLIPNADREFSDPGQVVSLLDKAISDLESKLAVSLSTYTVT